MHPALIIGTVRSLIVDVAMGQIPRSTERICSYLRDRMKTLRYYVLFPDLSRMCASSTISIIIIMNEKQSSSSIRIASFLIEINS